MVVLDRHPNTPSPAYLCNYQYKPLALPLLSKPVSPNPVPPLATSLFVSPSSASSLDLTRHQNSTVLHHTAHLQKPSPAAKLARTQEVLQRQKFAQEARATTIDCSPRHFAPNLPPSVHALQTSSLSFVLPSIKSADTPLLPDAYTYCCCCHGPHELSDTRHGTTAHHEPTAPDIWRIWPGWFTQCSSDTG